LLSKEEKRRNLQWKKPENLMKIMAYKILILLKFRGRGISLQPVLKIRIKT